MQAITVANTPTLLAAAGNRDFLHIFNNDSSSIFLSYDGDAATLTIANGFPVLAGTWYNLDNDGGRNLFTKPVYAISAAGGANVRLQGV